MFFKMCLLVICISSFEKYSIMSFVYILQNWVIYLFFYWIVGRRFSYIINTNPLSIVWILNIFPLFCYFALHFLKKCLISRHINYISLIYFLFSFIIVFCVPSEKSVYTHDQKHFCIFSSINFIILAFTSMIMMITN